MKILKKKLNFEEPTGSLAKTLHEEASMAHLHAASQKPTKQLPKQNAQSQNSLSRSDDRSMLPQKADSDGVRKDSSQPASSDGARKSSSFYSRTGVHIPSSEWTNCDTDIIGKGSYGIVYDAFQSNNPRQRVAVKVLDMCGRGLFSNATDCKRILREIKLLQALQHPNVVPLLDIIPPANPDNFNELALVFERADFDIGMVLKGPEVLSMDQVQYMMYQMLSALDYCHQRLEARQSFN